MQSLKFLNDLLCYSGPLDLARKMFLLEHDADPIITVLCLQSFRKRLPVLNFYRLRDTLKTKDKIQERNTIVRRAFII